MAIGTTLKISFDGAQVKRGLTDMKNGMKSLGKSAAIAGASVIAIGAGLAMAAKKALAVGMAINKMGEQAATAEKRIEVMARNTGEFGDQAQNVSKRLNDLSKTMARNIGVDNQSIKQTIAKTLAFKSLAATAGQTGGMFDRVVGLSYDLASATGKSAEALSGKLTKALEDPTRGITKLIAEGIKFTKEEQEKIKVMAESGRLMEAQELILSRLEQRYKGMAAEIANASDRIGERIAQLRQSFAMGFASAFSGSADSLDPFFESLMEPMKNIGQRIGDAIRAAFEGNADDLIHIGKAIGKVIGDGIQIGIKNAFISGGAWSVAGGRSIEDSILNSLGSKGRLASAGIGKLRGSLGIGSDQITGAASEILERDLQDLADTIRITTRQLADEQRNPNRMEYGGNKYHPIQGGLNADYDLFLNGQAYKLLERIAQNTQPAPL